MQRVNAETITLKAVFDAFFGRLTGEPQYPEHRAGHLLREIALSGGDLTGVSLVTFGVPLPSKPSTLIPRTAAITVEGRFFSKVDEAIITDQQWGLQPDTELPLGGLASILTCGAHTGLEQRGIERMCDTLDELLLSEHRRTAAWLGVGDGLRTSSDKEFVTRLIGYGYASESNARYTITPEGKKAYLQLYALLAAASVRTKEEFIRRVAVAEHIALPPIPDMPYCMSRLGTERWETIKAPREVTPEAVIKPFTYELELRSMLNPASLIEPEFRADFEIDPLFAAEDELRPGVRL